MQEEIDCRIGPEPEVQYRQHPAAILGKSDNEMTIFQCKHCHHLVINDTGYAIWKILRRPISLKAICAALSKEYNVDYLLCEQEVREWLDHALVKDIIQIVADRNKLK